MTMLSSRWMRRPRRSREEAIDLVRQHFLMQDERPADVDAVEVGSLDPFLRGLVFTDGTVTRALAVQTLAPVSVVRVEQAQAPVSADGARYLEIESGTGLVRRRVKIGVDAASPVLWAESQIVPERLPPGFLGLLDGAPDGIGQSLQRVALESYRELLWFGLDSPPAWAGAGGADLAVRRLYRIVCGAQASILISESFAVEWRSGTLRLSGLDGRAVQESWPAGGAE
jgi:chorismate-pyruvate lyase